MTLPAPLVIGDTVIKYPTALAPMAGYTDVIFRHICRDFHCGLVLTELVSCEGIIREASATMEYLETVPEEFPVGAQVFGDSPEKLAEAAKRIEAMGKFALIDINCGCPVPKVISKGAGVALMKQPQKIEAMVKAIREAVDIPVTAKTRIGLSPDEVKISEVAEAIENGGASMLAIHARFAINRHSGPADWEALAQIKSERTIPIVGNGGVWKAQDALDMLEQTGVDGAMMGRAAIGNPWIFDQIRALWDGEEPHEPTNDERKQVLERHLRGLVAKFQRSIRRKKPMDPKHGEIAACRHFRPNILKYLAGFRGVHTLSKNLGELDSVEQVMEQVDIVLANGRDGVPVYEKGH